MNNVDRSDAFIASGRSLVTDSPFEVVGELEYDAAADRLEARIEDSTATVVVQGKNRRSVSDVALDLIDCDYQRLINRLTPRDYIAKVEVYHEELAQIVCELTA